MVRKASLVALGAGGVLALEIAAYVWAIKRAALKWLG
jgi:hypothetical protein